MKKRMCRALSVFALAALLGSSLFAAEPSDAPPTKEEAAARPENADLNDALLRAGKSGKQILLLIRNAQNIGTLDAAFWLREPALQKSLEPFEVLILWNEHPSLKSLTLSKNAEFVLLSAKAEILATLDVPPLHAQMKSWLETLAKNPSALAKNTSKEIQEQFAKEHPESWQALRLAYTQAQTEYAKSHDEPKVKAAFVALLAAPIPAEELPSCVGLFTQALLQFDFEDYRQAVVQRVERELPVGRAAADVFLDLADIACEKNQHAEALRLYTQAEKASARGESPTLYRTARAMHALVEGGGSPNQTLWARRDIRNVVVIVQDYAGYLEAISQWTDREFWPVLFADDLYAPKFVSAFRPEQVVFWPSREKAKQESNSTISSSLWGSVPKIEEIRHVLLQSWSAEKNVPAEKISDETLRHRLKKLYAQSKGVVLGDGESGEMAGAIALAAGRFQGLEILPRPTIGNDAAKKFCEPEQLLTQACAEELAAQVQSGLQRWGFPQEDHWATVTLAGRYPYRYSGLVSTWGYGNIYALDDLLGRDENRTRIAVTSRLMGDAPLSAYQAMCSLFLQPESAFLFNTYNSDPKIKSVWSYYELSFLEKSLKAMARIPVTHLQNDQTRIENFRARVLPWNRDGLFWINSSGSAYQWSIPGSNGSNGVSGDGTGEDMPVGDPCVIHMIHSNSAAELYDPESIAGRALWGGAYWYCGAAAEPFLSGFQSARYAAPRVKNGAAFASVFRQRASQNFFLPWRIVMVGDPQFCLRNRPARCLPAADILEKFPKEARIETPAKRDAQLRKMSAKFDVSCKPEEFTLHIRQAHLMGNSFLDGENFLEHTDEKLLDGAGAAMALEDLLKADHTQRALTLWSNLTQQAQKNESAQRFARLAAGRHLDKMLEAKNLQEANAALKILQTTQPAKNFVERWVLKSSECREVRKK